jgi:hypothetical protein
MAEGDRPEPVWIPPVYRLNAYLFCGSYCWRRLYRYRLQAEGQRGQVSDPCKVKSFFSPPLRPYWL